MKWVFFSKHLIKAARHIPGFSEEEKNKLEEFELELDEYENYENKSMIPGFTKKTLQPFAFIARHAEPKGLYQVLTKGKTRFFL